MRAGATKLVKPAATTAALREIAPMQRIPLDTLVRIVAVLEILAAFTYAIPAAQRPGQILVGLLGISFAVMGVAGALRGSSVPCGCFGAESTRPLGTVNILMGVALIAIAGWNLAVQPTADAGVVASALVAVALSSGWLLVTHRRQIVLIAGNVLNRSESAT